MYGIILHLYNIVCLQQLQGTLPLKHSELVEALAKSLPS